MGFTSSILCCILYRLLHFAGFGLVNHYTEQSIGAIKMILVDLRSINEVGELILIILSHIQLHAGTCKPYLELKQQLLHALGKRKP